MIKVRVITVLFCMYWENENIMLVPCRERENKFSVQPRLLEQLGEINLDIDTASRITQEGGGFLRQGPFGYL